MKNTDKVKYIWLAKEGVSYWQAYGLTYNLLSGKQQYK